jgi:hypothetical protein
MAKPKPRRRVAAFCSDSHAGHVLGLLNPETKLVGIQDDGKSVLWTPELSETQMELWDDYTGDIRQAVEWAGKDELIVGHVGDLTQGTYRGRVIPGATLEDQREIGYWNMLPLCQLKTVRTMRLFTGTPVHVPEDAEARVAWKLATETGKDIKTYHHDRIRIDGVRFDVSHHGPHPGSRDWLEGNVALNYLRDRIYRDRRLGKEPSRVYVRGHFHHWVHVTLHDTWNGEPHTYDLVVLPSFCGLGEYARKVTASDPTLTTGFGLFEVVDGRLGEIRSLMHLWDLRTEEDL